MQRLCRSLVWRLPLQQPVLADSLAHANAGSLAEIPLRSVPSRNALLPVGQMCAAVSSHTQRGVDVVTLLHAASLSLAYYI
jgi:hypothetical protein